MTSFRSYSACHQQNIDNCRNDKINEREVINLRNEIQKQGFDVYLDEERGDFTFVEAREL